MTEEVAEQNTETETKPADNSLLSDTPEPLDFTNGRPETFPEDFWDGEKNSPDINKLFLSYDQEKRRAEGLRVKLSKGEFEGKAPKDVSEYALELSDELKAIAPDDDPLIASAKEAALAAGMPKEAFGKFMMPMIQKVAELAKQANEPPSEEEIKAAKAEELAKLGSNGKVVVQAVNGFIESLTASGKFSAKEAETLKEMVKTADSVRVLNKFRMMVNGNSVPVDLPVTDSTSRDEIAAKMAKAALSGDEIGYNKYAKQLHEMS